MKILSGLYKNHAIVSPKGSKTRPTSSKMRGSVFNILQHEIDGAHFLDLYAGSGAMGLEALSRGAASATFVDKDKEATRCIRQNLKALGIDAQVIQSDAISALKRLKSPFDIIYIDPPYELTIEPLLEKIGDHLFKNGTILVEQSSRVTLHVKSLHLMDKRLFGDSALYFFTTLK